MVGMAHWVVVVPAERYEAERMFLHESLELTGLDSLDGPLPAAGDEVALVAAGPEPVVFALGRVLAGADAADEVPDDPAGSAGARDVVDIEYTRRLFDAPLPAPGLPSTGPVASEVFAGLVAKADARGEVKSEWLVGLYLPIEAASPAEAVRAFWTFVQQLGPRELPAFVSPLGDELSMQSYVLGDLANQDPEED
jgi:hypothetical protein